MKFSKQQRELYKKGTELDRKEILKEFLERDVKTLKSSPDMNVLQKAQGRVEVLEEILSTFD